MGSKNRFITYSIFSLNAGASGSINERSGAASPASLRRPGEAGAVVEATLNWYGREADAAALEAAWQRLTALPCWIGSYTGSPADAAALKNLTSQLIGRFVSEIGRAHV